MRLGRPAIVAALALLIVVCSPVMGAQQAQKALTNADVASMVKQGVPDSVIISLIQSSPTKFDVSASAINELKQAGTSQKLLDTINATRNAPDAAAPASLAGPLPPGVKLPKAPTPINSPNRAASPPLDAAAKARIKAKLDAQIAAFWKNVPPAEARKTEEASKVAPEIESLERQRAFVDAVRNQTDGAPAAFVTAPSSTLGKPANQPGANPKAAAPTPKSSVTLIDARPAEKQAGSSSVQYQPPGGPNPQLLNGGTARLCLRPQIEKVNNATSGVVFTQDPNYNDYIIEGCGFGEQGGEVYLSGAVTNNRINMVVAHWSPNRIEAVVQPGLTGVLDGWPDLVVTPTGNPSAKFPNCRFYAQRQSVLLLGIPQKYAHLANVAVGGHAVDFLGTPFTFGTDYCPGPDLLHLFPCIGFNAGPPLDGISNSGGYYSGWPSESVSNAVDRDGGTHSFGSGVDEYDLSYMTPGFVVDHFSTHWYLWEWSVCQAWVAQGYGDPEWSNLGTYSSFRKGASGLVVEWAVDRCRWTDSFGFLIDDEYNSGYSLSVYVTGPIGVDPWTGKPVPQVLNLKTPGAQSVQ